MRHFRSFTTTVLALLLSARVGLAASDPTCTLPPSDAMASGTGGTYDTVYLPMWAYSQAAVDGLWSGFQCEVSDWDDGWGYEDVDNINLSLARLLNAGQVAWIVQQSSKHPGEGLWRSVTDAPAGDYHKGKWWDFVTAYAADEWEPDCAADDDAWGAHATDVDEYNLLYTGGAYQATAVERAGVVVHETTHQDVGHWFDIKHPCQPATASCDTVYGSYNSNTMEINFLHDAVLAYSLVNINGQFLREVSMNPNNDRCRWVPKLSESERDAAVARANAVMDRFAFNAWSGWKTALQNEVATKKGGEQWDCPQCDPEQWEFDPTYYNCTQTACNEVLNTQNIGINNHNQQVCETYNATVAAPGAGPGTVSPAQLTMLQQTLACLPADADLARAYCDARKPTSGSAYGVDPCGWLDDYAPAPEPTAVETVSSLQCVQEWCHEQFEAQPWGVDWGQDHQCFSYICDDQLEQCGDGGTVEECMEWFVAVHGDPDLYFAPCQWNKCKAKMVDCLKSKHAAGEWTYEQPLPAECVARKQLCEFNSRLALLAFIDLRPFIDPGPLREVIEGPLTENPGKNVYRFIDSFRRAADAGIDPDVLNQMAVEITSTPEIISALFNAAPGEFAWLYGREGFTEVLGPAIDSVQEVPITTDMLGPQGQAALAELERRLTAEGGTLEGAIGTFSQ